MKNEVGNLRTAGRLSQQQLAGVLGAVGGLDPTRRTP
jgi:hypothetical protein